MILQFEISTAAISPDVNKTRQIHLISSTYCDHVQEWLNASVHMASWKNTSEQVRETSVQPAAVLDRKISHDT